MCTHSHHQLLQHAAAVRRLTEFSVTPPLQAANYYSGTLVWILICMHDWIAEVWSWHGQSSIDLQMHQPFGQLWLQLEL